MGGSCGDTEDTPNPRKQRPERDYTKIHTANLGWAEYLNYSVWSSFDYPKYIYRENSMVEQHINLVFVEIPLHMHHINYTFEFEDGDKITPIKSDSRFSSSWDYVDIYGAPKNISVNNVTVSAEVPSNKRLDTLIKKDARERYFFETKEDAYLYYYGNASFSFINDTGSVLQDLRINHRDTWRYFNSWTNFVVLSPAYVKNANTLGVVLSFPIGRHDGVGGLNGMPEFMGAGFSIIFLGEIIKGIEEGYHTYITAPFDNRGSFDSIKPKSTAFVKKVQGVIYHESIHVFQQKIYGDENVHCTTSYCLMRQYSDLVTRRNVGNDIYVITNYSSSDFTKITLKSERDCWRHRLGGNIIGWVTEGNRSHLRVNEWK
jgi:hypothetical protein